MQNTTSTPSTALQPSILTHLTCYSLLLEHPSCLQWASLAHRRENNLNPHHFWPPGTPQPSTWFLPSSVLLLFLVFTFEGCSGCLSPPRPPHLPFLLRSNSSPQLSGLQTWTRFSFYLCWLTPSFFPCPFGNSQNTCWANLFWFLADLGGVPGPGGCGSSLAAWCQLSGSTSWRTIGAVTAALWAPAPGFVMVIGFSVPLCCLGNLRSKNTDASLSGSFCFGLG